MSSVKVTADVKSLSINTIRFLAIDAIQKANSGHPGIVMGCAPIALLLYRHIMKHNPANPKWFNRDRFILSAGHGSMLLYGILHLSGYDVTIDDIKQFRQWDSRTPGHPEYGLTPGVETTTGPLGQGLTNAVGMAVAQAHLAARYNKPDYNLIDHNIYVLASDGDIMEGITHEAASFAGHQALDNLIVFYDSNRITIDGKVSLSMSEDVAQRYEAYGWDVQRVVDVNILDNLDKAIANAKAAKGKPSMIIVSTLIGYGSPNKQDSESSHGSPLGEDEVVLTKRNLGWPEEEHFYVPQEVYDYFEEVKTNGKHLENEWNELLANYTEAYPEEAAEFKKLINNDFGEEWKKHLPKFDNYGEKVATRSASGKVINSVEKALPTMIGGSCDLTGSNNTYIKSSEPFKSDSRLGRNIFYGVREHGMAGIMNGMCLYGGVIPFGGTFLIFSDYLRPSIRLAGLSAVRPIYIFTHDSIGLGEDGPTHQPIEQLSSLRAIPDFIVIRPADANETVYAWQIALETERKPVAIALTRQKMPVIDRTKFAPAENTLKGGYVLKDADGTPDLIIIATGSEVYPSLEAALQLDKQGIKTCLVSMPSWEVFEQQSSEYKEEVLPSGVKARLSVEAGVKHGWERYIGLEGEAISIDEFGISAPYEVLFEEFGYSPESIAQRGAELVKKF